VFGGRFHNRLVRSDRHLVACLRYIARNPVAAGLARSVQAWPWTGHRALAGLESPGPLVAAEEALDYFAGEVERYVAFVERSDTDLLWALRRRNSGDRWLVEAIEHHGISAAVIAAELSVTPSTVYRRLAAARRVSGRRPVPPDAKRD
jgi:DNA-directed RNA polymerase specialized sigma24 family protein